MGKMGEPVESTYSGGVGSPRPPEDCANTPQVKICGLTGVDEALACAESGADAIGLVFYPPSPRNISNDTGRSIAGAAPKGVRIVGVFVNESFEAIMEKVEHCGFGAVQLHGKEPPQLVESLLREGLTVIKGLYLNGEPSVKEAFLYGASAYLVECRAAKLPGGNALAWDWSGAANALAPHERLVLAGGLTPENVALAICGASPDAVDVSSGVEASPGRKDIEKVKRFLEAVRNSASSRKPVKVF